jgi:hypothetical protein
LEKSAIYLAGSCFPIRAIDFVQYEYDFEFGHGYLLSI